MGDVSPETGPPGGNLLDVPPPQDEDSPCRPSRTSPKSPRPPSLPPSPLAGTRPRLDSELKRRANTSGEFQGSAFALLELGGTRNSFGDTGELGGLLKDEPSINVQSTEDLSIPEAHTIKT